MRIPIQCRLATPHMLNSIGIESLIRSNLIYEDTSFHLTNLFRISSLIPCLFSTVHVVRFHKIKRDGLFP